MNEGPKLMKHAECDLNEASIIAKMSGKWEERMHDMHENYATKLNI